MFLYFFRHFKIVNVLTDCVSFRFSSKNIHNDIVFLYSVSPPPTLLPSFQICSFLCKFLKICLRADGEIVRQIPFTALLHKRLQWLELGHFKARIWELSPGSPIGWCKPLPAAPRVSVSENPESGLELKLELRHSDRRWMQSSKRCLICQTKHPKMAMC